MKKYLYIVLALLAMMSTSCRENLTEYNKGDTELALTSNHESILLDQSEYNSDAIILQWTSGTNQGTGHRIYYSLEMTIAGHSFDESYLVFNGEMERYEQKWTVEELNELLHNEFEVAYGESVGITARITASGDGFETQTAECDFSATLYQPVSKTLYIIGKAVNGSWKPSDAEEMEMRETGYFKKTLMLKKGDFKLICTNESLLPGYMPGDTDEELVLRTESTQPNKMWTVTEDHLYEITANLITLKFSIKQVSAVKPEYDDIYLIGSETGWAFWPMQRDPLDPFLFRIGHYWTIGNDFKFGTASGAWENNYKATSADAPYTQESMAFIKGYDPDNKWVLNAAEINKMYKICVDIHTGQERMIMREFTPYTEMYLIGDATEAGWDLGNAVAMSQEDDSIFTWTGNLSAGALKFSCDKQANWNGAWFMPIASDKVPSGEAEPMLFVDKADDSITRYQYAQSTEVNVSDIDLKWNISEAGKYTITLDQLHETITIVKQ